MVESRRVPTAINSYRCLHSNVFFLGRSPITSCDLPIRCEPLQIIYCRQRLCAVSRETTPTSVLQTMAAVYKSLSKKDSKKSATTDDNGIKKNKQRVLVLSSRGVTFRYDVFPQTLLISPNLTYVDTAIF